MAFQHEVMSISGAGEDHFLEKLNNIYFNLHFLLVAVQLLEC